MHTTGCWCFQPCFSGVGGVIGVICLFGVISFPVVFFLLVPVIFVVDAGKELILYR